MGKNVEPKQIVSKGHSSSMIANNQQVKRNNIWAYGVHRNHVPVFEAPNPTTCSPQVLGQAALSTWHKIKREEAIENEVPRDSFKRRTFFTKPHGEKLDEIESLETKINRLY